MSQIDLAVIEILKARKINGTIRDWDRNFVVEAVPFNFCGQPVPELAVKHNCNFRMHRNDGSFLLVDTTGHLKVKYREQRKWINLIWLPANQGYQYMIINHPGQLLGMKA
jgi:hypothetical protein